jgi:hypothetical protein
MPRGFGTLQGMFLIGQSSRRAFDIRWPVGVGFALPTYAFWEMCNWTLGVSIHTVHFAMMLALMAALFIAAFPLLEKTAGQSRRRTFSDVATRFHKRANIREESHESRYLLLRQVYGPRSRSSPSARWRRGQLVRWRFR